MFFDLSSRIKFLYIVSYSFNLKIFNLTWIANLMERIKFFFSLYLTEKSLYFTLVFKMKT